MKANAACAVTIDLSRADPPRRRGRPSVTVPTDSGPPRYLFFIMSFILGPSLVFPRSALASFWAVFMSAAICLLVSLSTGGTSGGPSTRPRSRRRPPS